MILGNQISLEYTTRKGPAKALRNVSFTLEPGRITAFMGHSGSGKTTLLKCIANLHSHYEGLITCDGKNLKNFSSVERASKIGFVLQQFHLFPHLTVLQNCTYALVESAGMAKKEAQDRALEMLNALEMHPFAHAFPMQISGGQQQRAAIARALVLQPEVLLLDEPTSALDPESKKRLELLLLGLNAKGISIEAEQKQFQSFFAFRIKS